MQNRARLPFLYAIWKLFKAVLMTVYNVKQLRTEHPLQACLLCQTCWVKIHRFLSQFQHLHNRKSNSSSLRLPVAELLSDGRLHVWVCICVCTAICNVHTHLGMCVVCVPKPECRQGCVRKCICISVWGRERDRKATEVMLCEEMGVDRQIVSFPHYHH